MSNIRALSILSVVILLAAFFFSKDGIGESRRSQSNDEISELKASVEKLKSEVKTLQTKMETIPGFEKYDKEQLGFLEEYLKAVESYHSRIKAMHAEETIGLSMFQMSLFELHRAKARLAQGKGNLKLCQKEYEATRKAAEGLVEAWEALFMDTANPARDLSELLKARSKALEAKLSLSRVKRMNQRVQKQ